MKLLAILLSFSVTIQLFAKDETRNVGDFDQLLLKSKFQVSLIQGDENKVVIDILEEGEEIENLITEVNEGVLEIYTKKKDFKDKNFHVTVYYKDLKEIHVKNDGEVFTEPNVFLKADSISLRCSVGGKIKVGINAKSLSTTIKHGGSILIEGSSDKLYATILTGGRLSASKLKNKSTWAEVKMGGTMILKPQDYLDAKVSAGGNIKYQGEPKKIDEKVSLGGEIKKIK